MIDSHISLCYLMIVKTEATLNNLKTEFMNQHPLRQNLKKKDWIRIQKAIDTRCYDSITKEEIDAANDVLYDAIAGQRQTHLGVIILQ